MEGVWTLAIAFIALYLTAMVDSQGQCNATTCETQAECLQHKCSDRIGTCMPKKKCISKCLPPNECKARGGGRWCRKHRNCKCCIPRCGACIAPEHGYTIGGNPPPNPLGALCEYHCNDGYHIEHLWPGGIIIIIAKCIKNGTIGSWSSPTPKCIPNTCETCGEPQNGNTTGDNPPNPIGTNCTYHCDPGHQLEGHNTTECLPNGEWSNQIPTCRPNTCDTCGEPQNGFTTGDNHPLNHIGTTCTYHCDEGHHLEGHETAICLSNETWSNPIPQCKPNTCDTCGIPQDGSTIGDNPPNSIGTICEYSCVPGYILIGSETTQCVLDGTWSKTLPECIPDCINDRKCNRESGQCYPIGDPILKNHTACPNLSPEGGGRRWCKDSINCRCCY